MNKNILKDIITRTCKKLTQKREKGISVSQKTRVTLIGRGEAGEAMRKGEEDSGREAKREELNHRYSVRVELLYHSP